MVDQKQKILEQVEAAYRVIVETWAKQTALLGLDQKPGELAVWLERRQRALDSAAEAKRARQLASEAKRKRDEARGRLVREIQNLGEAVDADSAFTVVYDTAALVVRHAQGADVARGNILSRQKASNDEHRSAGRLLGDAQTALTNWSGRWENAVKGASLDPDQPHAVIRAQLELLEDLRIEIEEIRGLDQRIEGMTRDIDEFSRQVEAAASACGVGASGKAPADLLTGVASAVAEAKTALVRQEGLVQQLVEAKADLAAAQEERVRALGRLTPLFAAVATNDHDVLQEAIRRSDEVRAHELERDRLRSDILKAGGGPPLDQLLAECEDADAGLLTARSQELEEELGAISAEAADLAGELATTRADFVRLDAGPDAAVAAADAEIARAEMTEQAEAYVRKRAEVALLRSAIAQYRSSKQAPLLTRASALFSRLTIGRFKSLLVDFDNDASRLAGLTHDDRVVPVVGMSEGTIDQLFLALRLAAVEDAVASGVKLPFLADDLFINYDDARAKAGFEVLAELARNTQVLFFTHHEHLLDVAERALAPIPVSRCRLEQAA